MLDELREFETVEEAAEESAGNWKNWKHFAWFGADDVPDSHNVMLGYMVGPQSSSIDDANFVTVTRALQPFIGSMLDLTSTVGHYGASLHGDQNAAKGFMVRVYQDGLITDAFKKLYEIAKQTGLENFPLNEDDFKNVTRQSITKYVLDDVVKACNEKNVPYTIEILNNVVSWLMEDEPIFEDLDDDEIEKAIKECVKKRKAK